MQLTTLASWGNSMVIDHTGCHSKGRKHLCVILLSSMLFCTSCNVGEGISHYVSEKTNTNLQFLASTSIIGTPLAQVSLPAMVPLSMGGKVFFHMLNVVIPIYLHRFFTPQATRPRNRSIGGNFRRERDRLAIVYESATRIDSWISYQALKEPCDSHGRNRRRACPFLRRRRNADPPFLRHFSEKSGLHLIVTSRGTDQISIILSFRSIGKVFPLRTDFRDRRRSINTIIAHT